MAFQRMTDWKGQCRPSCLVGRTPTALRVSYHQHDLEIQCEDGKSIWWGTDGDCCSESWWADIVGVKQFLGYEVLKVETVYLPQPQDQERSRQEVDQAYAVKATTTGGVCEFIFRNSSNGYYGGEWLEAVAKVIAVPSLTEITEDWRA